MRATEETGPLSRLNPSLRGLAHRLVRSDRRVVAVVSAAELDAWPFRSTVHRFFKTEFQRLTPNTVYVADNDRGPGLWGHRLSHSAGIHEHVLFTPPGAWRHCYAGEVVKTGGWLDASLRATRDDRIENLMRFLYCLKLFDCPTGCLLLGVKNRESWMIRSARHVADKYAIPYTPIRFSTQEYVVSK